MVKVEGEMNLKLILYK